jgi:hypothetical protein
MVIAETLQFGYETFLDTIEDEQSQSAGAVRLARMRRNRGVPVIYPGNAVQQVHRRSQNIGFQYFRQ